MKRILLFVETASVTVAAGIVVAVALSLRGRPPLSSFLVYLPWLVGFGLVVAACGHLLRVTRRYMQRWILVLLILPTAVALGFLWTSLLRELLGSVIHAPVFVSHQGWDIVGFVGLAFSVLPGWGRPANQRAQPTARSGTPLARTPRTGPPPESKARAVPAHPAAYPRPYVAR